MKDNIKAKMVNELRIIAMQFHDYQCLREKIVGVLQEHIGRDWDLDTNYGLEGLIEDVKLRDRKIVEVTLEVITLRNENRKLRRAMEEFVTRCEEGSIRSIRTYNKFKDILEDK